MRKYVLNILVITFLSLSAFLLLKAMKMAYYYENYLHTSPDFGIIIQAAKLFWQDKIDIYKLSFEYLKDSTKFQNNYEYMVNAKYTHLFYIILFPYTLFSIQLSKLLWFATNLLFLILIVYDLSKIFNLNFKKSLLLFSLFSTSAPLYNCLIMGQTSIVILYFLISYFYKNNYKSIYLTISLTKYSLSVVFLFLSLFKDKKDVALLILINIFAILFYSFHINHFYFKQIFNPVLVGLSTGSMNNFGTLMNFNYLVNYYYVIILLYVTIICFVIYKKKTHELFIFLLVSSIIFVFHKGYYDSVMVFPLIAYVISSKTILNKRERDRWVSWIETIVYMAYFLYLMYFPHVNYIIKYIYYLQNYKNYFFDFNNYSLNCTILGLISLVFLLRRIILNKSIDSKAIK